MKQMEYTANQKYEVLHSGEYRGFKFFILTLGTHPTAYVENKFGYVFMDYDDLNQFVGVHGGFTFNGKIKFDEETRRNYLGWDYAHFGDYSGVQELYPEIYTKINDKKWTTEEIFEEVKSVIDQFIEKKEQIQVILNAKFKWYN